MDQRTPEPSFFQYCWDTLHSRETMEDLNNDLFSLDNIARDPPPCCAHCSSTEQIYWQAALATLSEQEGTRNESGPEQFQEMEDSTGAGATAALAAPLPENSHTFHESNAMTAGRNLSPPNASTIEQRLSLLQTPDNSQYIDHFQASNVRGASEQQYASSMDDAETEAANILTNGAGHALNGHQAGDLGIWPGDLEQAIREDSNIDVQLQNPPPLLSHADPDPQNMQGYAKLLFPDGDYFVTTHDLIVGRDMDYWEALKRRQKAEQRAEKASFMYDQEPSQPGDEGQQLAQPSNSSQSLQGRPAPPNNYSERGGAVSYAPYSDGEVEVRPAKRQRRSLQFSKSSSTTSIAPRVLHPNMMSDFAGPNLLPEDNEPLIRTWAFLPVHPPSDGDILKISREHLKFTYNFQEARWELHIVGNRAFVNYELYEKGERVVLHHNDDIMIVALEMTFKLPDNYRDGSPGPSRGTFSMKSDGEDNLESDTALSTSPIRKLSHTMEAGENENGDEEEEEVGDEKAGRKRPKLKVKTKGEGKENIKGSNKKIAKQQKKKTHHGQQSVEVEKTREKGKKAEAATNGPAEDLKKDKTPSPVDQYHFEPGSLLADLPPGQLPEKRKGPGRPPKNGFLSKRDENLVRRKQRDYLRRGEEPPSLDRVIDEVRREEKLREAQRKAEANGQELPDQPILQSIETDAPANRANTDKFPTVGGIDQASTTPAEPVKRPSPKPKRTVRSPSPMKPEAECTEEELKKPIGTYVHILDEILREHPTGKADLSDIYDRIMKKYPYYKYRQSTHGWQSSVRHNLLQNPRFIGDGRSGKGKVWTLNWDVSIDRERNRRRPTPPQRANGQFMSHSMQYGNPYGAPGQQNGQPQYNAGQQASSYYSPYAPSGQAGAAQTSPGQNGTQSYSQQPQLQRPPAYHPGQPNGAPNQPTNPPPAPLDPFGGLIQEIMAYRQDYLQPFEKGPPFDTHQALFQNITKRLSDLFHAHQDVSAAQEGFETEEERTLTAKLASIFKPYEDLAKAMTANGTGTHSVENEGAGVTVGGGVQQAVSNANATGGAETVSGPSTNTASPTTVPDQATSASAQESAAGTADVPPGAKRAYDDDVDVDVDEDGMKGEDAHAKRLRM